MAIARQTDAAKVKPGRTAIITQGVVGATIAAGEAVAVQSDGYWDPAIATGVVKNVGVAVQGGAVGDTIDIVILGPVECVTGATPGEIVYVSDTAGEPAETAGTKSAVIGYAVTATKLIVMPQTVAFS
jgi:hypothetical protein